MRLGKPIDQQSSYSTIIICDKKQGNVTTCFNFFFFFLFNPMWTFMLRHINGIVSQDRVIYNRR